MYNKFFCKIFCWLWPSGNICWRCGNSTTLLLMLTLLNTQPHDDHSTTATSSHTFSPRPLCMVRTRRPELKYWLLLVLRTLAATTAILSASQPSRWPLSLFTASQPTNMHVILSFFRYELYFTPYPILIIYLQINTAVYLVPGWIIFSENYYIHITYTIYTWPCC